MERDDDGTDVEENHVTYGREPARWKLPKVRDYCFSRRRDARGRSVSKSVFAPSLLVPHLRERREKRVKRETENGRRPSAWSGRRGSEKLAREVEEGGEEEEEEKEKKKKEEEEEEEEEEYVRR